MLGKIRKSKSKKESQRNPNEFKDFVRVTLASASLYGNKEKEELAKSQSVEQQTLISPLHFQSHRLI